MVLSSQALSRQMLPRERVLSSHSGKRVRGAGVWGVESSTNGGREKFCPRLHSVWAGLKQASRAHGRHLSVPSIRLVHTRPAQREASH